VAAPVGEETFASPHPSKRLDLGHRLYSSADLLRLQQVLTLRYLGFELPQIQDLLQRADFDVRASLQIQRGMEAVAERRTFEPPLAAREPGSARAGSEL
jgi:DNA-binding transcriptional MerR regulator